MPIIRVCFFIIPVLLLLVSSGTGTAAPELNKGEISHGQVSPVAETIWTCSMHPQIQLPHAGQCPICFMDLIEVKRESSEDRQNLRQISLDDRAQKLAQVEVQPVIRGNASARIRMVGRVEYDETRVGTITSRVNGRIDKLYVDYTGSQVKRGQIMAEVYSPELLTAQAELIQAAAALKRSGQTGNALIRKTATRTLEASRDKLRLLGLSKKQLQAISKQGKPTDHITLTAPLSGVVIKKNVTEGMYVKTGSPIYTLADLARVWVVLQAYESDIQAIFLGQQVDFSVESYPGSSFRGEVAYIDPLVDSASRTVRVRLNVDNQEAKLKPGMFVRATAINVSKKNTDQAPLLVPASAPLFTGKRALVYVQLPDKPGVYVGREIIPGRRLGDYYQVKSGLEEGELVVTRGNFKIDSAIQLQGRPSMMNPYQDEDGETVRNNSLPTLFVSRIALLNQAFIKLSKDVHTNNREKQVGSLAELSRSLEGIKGEKLEKEDRLSWQEVSMLLTSDILLLQETENIRENDRIYATLAEHFYQLRNRFGLDDGIPDKAGSALLRKKISLLLTRYLNLQQHLASDNVDQARDDSRLLLSLVKAVNQELQATGQEQANILAASLSEEIKMLISAKDLAAIRTAFYPLSKTLARIVEVFGSSINTPLYLQFCPMAFGNTGATWLSKTEEINNPYFGAMMLRCGEVRQQIAK